MISRSPAKLLLLSSWFLAICSNHVLAEMDEKEMEIEAWFDLVRYMLGLSFVIFAIFSLLYRPIATRVFLRRFDQPDKIEEINGVVLSCEEMQGFVKRYELQVHYTGRYAPTRRRHADALLESKFLKRMESNWHTPRGSSIPLIMLKNIPRSACSREWIEKERAQAACAREVVMMVPALCLLTLLLTFCIHEIVNFPENTRNTGWFVLGAIVTVVVWVSWSFADHQFQKSMLRQRVLTAVPLKEPKEEEHQHDEEQRQVKVQQASN
jgi:hypothetical protein